jgi:hypothetical protein
MQLLAISRASGFRCFSDTYAAGEDLRMEEFARWLKPIVTEVPVQFIPTTDEFWTV